MCHLFDFDGLERQDPAAQAAAVAEDPNGERSAAAVAAEENAPAEADSPSEADSRGNLFDFDVLERHDAAEEGHDAAAQAPRAVADDRSRETSLAAKDREDGDGGAGLAAEEAAAPLPPDDEAAEAAEADADTAASVAFQPGRFLVVQPVGDLCTRVQAVLSAGIMAKDLGRELGLLWRPDTSCNCPWERLFGPASWIRVLAPPALAGGDEGHLEAAVQLLGLWDLACAASGHEDLLELALERFDRAHWSHFHAGLACLVDHTAPAWQNLPRFGVGSGARFPDALRAACVCIRASGDFYPARPGTRHAMGELHEERALLMHQLPLAPALLQRLKQVKPGTVSVDAAGLEAARPGGKEDEAAELPGAEGQLQPLEEAMGAFAAGARGSTFGAFLVAGCGPRLQGWWSGQYSERISFCAARAPSSSVPHAVEDTLVSLAMLARGTQLLTTSLGPRSDIIALLGSAAVEMVRGAPGTEGTPAGEQTAEAAVRLLDPSEPEGPFCVAGSWDDWKVMRELRPVKHRAGDHETRITVSGNQTLEFQLFRGADWSRRFFPTEDGLIWGPAPRQGANWRIHVPGDCVTLNLVWNPRGTRSLEWTFMSAAGQDVRSDASKVLSQPFFVAGSWDGWRAFTELSPGSAGGGPPYRAKIPVAGLVEEFQVFRGRDWQQRYCPSAWGGKIRGPSGMSGSNWRVEVPVECKWLKVTWDPRGHKSLRWRLISANERVIEEAKPKPPAPEPPRARGARPILPARINSMDVPQRLGSWRLLSLLGRGYVGAVFRASPWCEDMEDDDVEEEVALKFPALGCELEALRRLRNVQGVPRLLDEGFGPGGSLFCAMPVLGPSLKSVMRLCNHDGRGGRVSWYAARSLGVRLVRALGGIHSCGLVHCDVNPGNILFRLADAEPQLIDFGWARNIGSAHFDRTVGTCMYNSVRAGFGGQRTPVDDLESVGWLLLQCVLGRLPWAERDEGVSVKEVEAWQRRSEGISVAKELFLAERILFGPEFDHCPPELADYLRLCQAAGPDPAAHVDYGRLATTLCERGNRESIKEHWARLLDLAAGQLEGDILYSAARGLICYRPAGKPREGGTEKVCSVPKDFLIRTTGGEARCAHGGRWVEVDPLWAPKLPPALLDSSWLLLSKVTLPKVPWEDDTEKHGPLLVPAGPGAGAA